MSNLTDLKKNIHDLTEPNNKKIMYILINIYIDECSFNEGSLGFKDLITIFYILRENERRILL